MFESKNKADIQDFVQFEKMLKWYNSGGIQFRKLRLHPFLQSPQERFHFPILTQIHFNSIRNIWHVYWKQAFSEWTKKKGRQINLVKSINGRKGFIEVYHDKTYRTEDYKDDAAGELDYVRNCSIHVNQHLPKDEHLEKDQVEKLVSEMFPGMLSNLYQFCQECHFKFEFLDNKFMDAEPVTANI